MRSSPFLVYNNDGLNVKYTGKGLLYTDINVIGNFIIKSRSKPTNQPQEIPLSIIMKLR
jgi:hypothetical protein